MSMAIDKTKQRIHRNLRKLARVGITFYLYPILKKFGYFAKQVTSEGFPKSHYYESARALNHFVGLHTLPQSQAWINSKRENTSVKNGEFIPWITYSALNLIEKLPLKNMNILEFGSGASTIWFSEKSKNLSSFEFDSEFYRLISPFVSIKYGQMQDVRLIGQKNHHTEIDKEFELLLRDDERNCGLGTDFWSQFDSNLFRTIVSDEINSADLIFIDGGPRTFLMALANLTTNENCLIVVDNTDVDYVRLGIPNLLKSGWVEIPLRGPGPLNPYEWQTSLFIKSLEALRA